MSRAWLILTLLLVGPVLTSTAEQPLVKAGAAQKPTVSLGALLQEALQHNPRLLAAQQRARAAVARTNFMRGLPDPELAYEYDRITPSSSQMGEGKVAPMKAWMLAQEVPFPTKLFLRKKVAQREAAAQEQEVAETRRALIRDVKSAYYTLALNQRKKALTSDTLLWLRQIATSLNQKYALGQLGQMDVLRIQVETAKTQNELILLESEVKIATARLAALLGRDDGDLDVGSVDVSLAATQLFPEEEIIQKAKENRPELQSYRQLLERSRLELSLSRQELLPDLKLTYKREQRDGSLKEGEWSGTIGINVPLWFWGKQFSGIREAKANYAAAQADYRSEEDTVVFEAQSALAQYEASRQMGMWYENGILPQATGTVNTSKRAFETGTGSLTDLLEAIRMLRQLQAEYALAVAGTLTALADLEQAVGGDLSETAVKEGL